MDPKVAIVLGAAVWPGGVPSPTLRRRAAKAAELYLSGEVSMVLATGGLGDNGPSEAAVIREVVVALGVPDTSVILEAASRTTLENLAFAMPMLPPKARAVIVSDLWHLPRARLTAHRLGFQASGAAPSLKGAHPGRVTRAVLREIAAFFWYLVRPLR